MFIEMMSNKLEKNLGHSSKFYNYQFEFFLLRDYYSSLYLLPIPNSFYPMLCELD